MNDKGLPQGWGFPGAAKRAHYFLEGDATSLCRKWMFTGDREDTMHQHSANCAECKRRRERLFPAVIEQAAVELLRNPS